ncbi:MAG: YgaP family membrane protein [Thermosulfidibacteraceae bacterium]|jgi:hypothetical protein
MRIYRLPKDRWYIERINFLLAGIFTFLSVLLYFITGKVGFLYFTLFVGFMLMFFAITGICPSSIFLGLIGVKSVLETYCNEKEGSK